MKKRIICLFMAISMLLIVLPSPVHGDDLADALARQRELQERLNEINRQINEIKDNVQKLAAMRETHAERLNNVKEQIENLKIEIENTKLAIAEKQQELDEKQMELDYNIDQFARRLRTIYMSNDSNDMSVLLGSSSFSEFLVLGEYMRSISVRDTNLISDITDAKAEIAEMKKELEVSLIALEDLQAELDLKYEQLAALLREADSDLSQAKAMQHAREDESEEILKEIARQNEYIAQLMNQPSDIEYVGGYFTWPVPGFGWISSGYGMRILYGRENFHGGIDIAGRGIYGKSAIASNDGIVQKVIYGSTGYGYYVIVDHGGGYKTLYAHLSSIYVSEGDFLVQGTPVGAVGSTGNSTGPHLHFEIRIAGERVDPTSILQDRPSS